MTTRPFPPAPASLPVSLQVANLIVDLSLLAVACGVAQAGGPGARGGAEPIYAAALQVLGSWQGGARVALAEAGLLGASAVEWLLNGTPWQPVLQQAAVQMATAQQAGQPAAYDHSGPGMREARRQVQRAARLLADGVRRSSST
jgi:hypothetical protein